MPKPPKRSARKATPTRGRADLERVRRLSDAEIARTSPDELRDLPDDFWHDARVVMPVTTQARFARSVALGAGQTETQYRAIRTPGRSHRMRIQRSRDCGNSPKNILLEDLAVAILSGDAGRVTALTTDSVSWRAPGRPIAEGQAAVVRLAERERPTGASTLIIQHVVSHGRAGAVTATIQRGRQAAAEVCLFFTFANAKGSAVDSIVTYHGD